MRNTCFLGLLSLFVISSCNTNEMDDFALNQSSKSINTTIQKSGDLITLKSGAVVEKVDGKYIYLGDILLSESQLQTLDETGSIFSSTDKSVLSSTERPFDVGDVPMLPQTGLTAYSSPKGIGTMAVGVSPHQNKFWAMMRFTFANNLNEWQKRQILDAMAYMESETNIRFYNATGEPTRDPKWGFDYPYVEFNSSTVNQSFIGRKGGKQELYLVDFHIKGTIVHEICHALGMFHEQSRADRDNYITVHYNNMDPDPKIRSNFNKETRNYYMIGAFDFNSVMLYGSYYYSSNHLPTITKKDGSTYVHNREGLSELDRMFINKFYLPYVARPDVCSQLDTVVYDENNNPISEEARIELERRLNVNRCRYPLP